MQVPQGHQHVPPMGEGGREITSRDMMSPPAGTRGLVKEGVGSREATRRRDLVSWMHHGLWPGAGARPPAGPGKSPKSVCASPRCQAPAQTTWAPSSSSSEHLAGDPKKEHPLWCPGSTKRSQWGARTPAQHALPDTHARVCLVHQDPPAEAGTGREHGTGPQTSADSNRCTGGVRAGERGVREKSAPGSSRSARRG